MRSTTTTIKPYKSGELIALALNKQPADPLRVIATFGDPSNWVQLYNSNVSPALAEGGDDYQPKACMWGWRGPVLPPYELADHCKGAEDLKQEVIDEICKMIGFGTGDVSEFLQALEEKLGK